MVQVVAAILSGLILSVVLEGLLHPKPSLRRACSTWSVHIGIWMLAFVVQFALFGRPWFSAAATNALLLIVVLVNNAKFKSLREPFVFQDVEYFTDAIKHPRLFIPFMGFRNFLLAACGVCCAVILGIFVEPRLGEAWSESSSQWPIAIGLAGCATLLVAGCRNLPRPSLNPEADLASQGLLPSLVSYGLAERHKPTLNSPFASIAIHTATQPLPNLVAVQSESFFDPRPLFHGINPRVLREFDAIKAQALVQGRLKVPAWGANTVRTEFAFLAGVDESQLGVHRFNPYRSWSAGMKVATLPGVLKQLGYRLVLIHPYPVSFYRRDKVYAIMGFDQVVDIRHFTRADRHGPYIGDKAVAQAILNELNCGSQPVFIFAVTMENHGPLHLEQPQPGETERLYTTPPAPDCDDLTIYLRHLANADAMIGTLRHRLAFNQRPTSLCWFGDHVPIMPAVYQRYGAPNGEVHYVIWHSQGSAQCEHLPLASHQLGLHWLHRSGIIR